eukprot:8152307-Pyramimonas_sp.AAC.1
MMFTAGARPEETIRKKPNPPGRPWTFGATKSRFPSQKYRNPKIPGHPGGKQGVCWHGPPVYAHPPPLATAHCLGPGA